MAIAYFCQYIKYNLFDILSTGRGEKMLFNIKARLCLLGKKIKDLIPELEKCGLKVTPADLSNALNGVNTAPRAQQIVSTANRIVNEWEENNGVGKASN